MAAGRFDVRWSAAAGEDLDAILAWVKEQDRPEAAAGILEKIRASAAGLDRLPGRGRVVPEFASLGLMAFRELVLPPWRLVYAVEGKIVKVHLVVDARRNLPDLLFERLIRRPRR